MTMNEIKRCMVLHEGQLGSANWSDQLKNSEIGVDGFRVVP